MRKKRKMIKAPESVYLPSKQADYVKRQEEQHLEINTDEALKRLTECTGLAIDFCHFHS